jgi:Putative Ig domain/Cadherin-like domain
MFRSRLCAPTRRGARAGGEIVMTAVRRWAGLWVLSLVIIAVAALVVTASPPASAAPVQPAAPSASAAPVQMNYACTSKVTGLMRYVSSPTGCTKSENAVTIVPGPVYLCVYFNFAVRQVAAASDCPSSTFLKEVTLPPTSGPVYFCALKLGGLLTYTTNPSSCNATLQFPVVVPVPNRVSVTNPGNQTGTVGTAVSLQIQASDSASGQTLTYSATGLPAGLSIASSTGLISGTPTTAGTSSVTVTATDTTGASGSASFTWTINPAQPPTAVNQSYNAVGNTTLAVGTTVTGPAATVSASQGLLNGDSGNASCGTLTVTGNTTPAHGTVTVNPAGTFTYLPAAGFSGTDTFQYTITCGTSGTTASATVTITVGTVVWYVDDSQAAAGTGESNAPFNTLAAANSAVGANSIVFLYQGNATYTGGLTMKSGDDLWGQPHGLTVGSYDMVAPGGSNPTITNSGGDGIDLASNTDVEYVTVSGASANGISGSGVTGTVTIANSTVTTAGVNNAIITDTSGTLDLTVTASTFSNSTASGANNGSYGLIINADGSTDATVSVTGSTFTGNTGDGFRFATASGATGTDSVTFSNNQVSGVGIKGGGSGASISQLGNNTTTITIDGNNVQNITDNGIGVDNEGSGTVSGTINGNTVGSPTAANSGGSNSISATAEGAGTETLAITSNKLYQYDDFAGIYYIDREGSPTLNLTITSNTLADPAGNNTIGGAWGIYGEAGARTGDAGKVCAAITGNSLTGAGQTNLGSADIELDQNIAGVTYELPGYTGGSTDTNAVQTFVAGNNNGGGTPSVIATVTGAPGFVGGASCPAP